MYQCVYMHVYSLTYADTYVLKNALHMHIYVLSVFIICSLSFTVNKLMIQIRRHIVIKCIDPEVKLLWAIYSTFRDFHTSLIKLR